MTLTVPSRAIMTKRAHAALICFLFSLLLDSEARSDQPLLSAPDGVTALSGVVLDQSDHPISGVMVGVHGREAQTDADGRFLLAGIRSGRLNLWVDGTRVGSRHDQDYGYYNVSVTAKSGYTTPTGFTIWLTPINHTYDVSLSAPMINEVVATTPLLPGLELHIPRGVTVRDHFGHPVSKIGITPVSSKRPPFPLAGGTGLSGFFTIQPGGVCFYDAAGMPGQVRLFLPNSQNESPSAKKALFRYSADYGLWVKYGTGVVSADGRQIVPSPRSTISNIDGVACAASFAPVGVSHQELMP